MIRCAPLTSVCLLILVGCQKNEVQPAPDINIAAPPATQSLAFLCLPFHKGTAFQITEGWLYSTQEQAIHGYIKHRGIDFATKRGIEVLAAADGYAVSSCHIQFPGKTYEGKRIGFALGRFVQIWHPEQGVFSQYGHLESIAEGIPYLEPIEDDGQWDPKAIYVPGPKLDLTRMKSVKRGEVVGYVGDSGLSWGYDETPTKPRPDPAKFPSWDETHLHFEIYTRDDDGLKDEYFDPFAINGEVADYQDIYKPREGELWLRNELSITFADE